MKKNSTIASEIVTTAPVDEHDNTILTPKNRRWLLDLLKKIDARDEQWERRYTKRAKRPAKKATRTKAPR